MNITVFTSNQPRHVALIEALAPLADQVWAVQECNTVFPGRVADFFRRSEVMQRYFARVVAAEEAVFGRPRFLPGNVRSLPLKMADLNLLELEALEPALHSDLYVVFGATYIKPPLIDHLVSQRALNIHMGISPYYRGSSCNFWAMYDRRPDRVGATIHLLSRGLDSGPMLCHAVPAVQAADPFVLGMLAVRAAHQSLVEMVRGAQMTSLEPVAQDKSRQVRYTKNADFTDEVALEYLKRLPSPAEVEAALKLRDNAALLRCHAG